MASNADHTGKLNDKVPDTDIQGDKAGKRNRASTADGVMPPPAGESGSQRPDPRSDSAQGSKRS
jgi:hypothetical protein